MTPDIAALIERLEAELISQDAIGIRVAYDLVRDAIAALTRLSAAQGWQPTCCDRPMRPVSFRCGLCATHSTPLSGTSETDR